MEGIVVLCLSLGDSLAVGVGQQLPQCRVEAEIGITSARYAIEHRSPHYADRVVISLGVNDGAGANTLENLARVRSAVSARSVIWLLPFGHSDARAAIQTIARRFGDRTIDTSPFVGVDKLHPTEAGYRTLAQLVSLPTTVMAGRDPAIAGPFSTRTLFQSFRRWPPQAP